MADKTLFTGTTHVKGGAEGYARSTNGVLDIQLPEPHPAAENLFAAAWSACFLGALKVVAGKEKVALPADSQVSGAVGIGALPTGFGIEVDLAISLPGLDREQAQALIDKAHAVCPYSNATRNNIDVRLSLV